MAFPTATVTQGAGLTINTLPNAGANTRANSLGICLPTDQALNQSISVTPTITAATYTAGFVLGGKLTFAVGNVASGILQSISVTAKTIQTTALKVYVFDSNPTNSTWTDHAAPAINAADAPFLRGMYPIFSPDNGLGTHTIWNLEGIGASFVAGNLYAIVTIVTTTTVAFAAGEVIVKLGVMGD